MAEVAGSSASQVTAAVQAQPIAAPAGAAGTAAVVADISASRCASHPPIPTADDSVKVSTS